jgi:hypothetical protein
MESQGHIQAKLCTHYRVCARFDNTFHPIRKELHDEAMCDTLEDAEKALDEIKRHGGYCEAEIRRFDVRACDISYIQLSLLGYAAVVQHMDALAMRRVWRMTLGRVRIEDMVAVRTS